MSSDFNWSDSESVVTKPVRGVAAHWNPDGDVVIRVQADDPNHPAYDDALVVPAKSLDDLIKRLIAMRAELAEQDK